MDWQADYDSPWKEIIEHFRFLDWIMTLTPPLAAEFEQSLATYEESQQMKYITTIERKGIEKGIEQGLEAGREQSMRDAVVEVLTVRFEEAPVGLQQRLDEIHDVDQLKTLHREAVLAPSLAAFVAYLEESV